MGEGKGFFSGFFRRKEEKAQPPVNPDEPKIGLPVQVKPEGETLNKTNSAKPITTRFEMKSPGGGAEFIHIHKAQPGEAFEFSHEMKREMRSYAYDLLKAIRSAGAEINQSQLDELTAEPLRWLAYGLNEHPRFNEMMARYDAIKLKINPEKPEETKQALEELEQWAKDFDDMIRRTPSQR